MGISSSQMNPQELVSFKKLPTSVCLESIEIPELAENRKPTNVKWLVILGVFIAVMLPFMIYTLCYSDIRRVTVGTDKCGNVCGENNYKWDGISCSGQDFTSSPYLEYEDAYTGGPLVEGGEEFKDRRCVQSCKSGYVEHFGRCYKSRSYTNSYQNEYSEREQITQQVQQIDIELGAYFSGIKWQLIISCLLSILVAMGMLFLFRYAVAFVVWGILLGCLLALMIVVAGLWYLYIQAPDANNSTDSPKNQSKQVFLVFGIVGTVFALALALVLVWCRKKIRLVILLLKETTKAVFDMPGLILIPCICVVCILVLTGLFFLTTLFMASAGTLHSIGGDFYSYQQNPVMVFTMAYNFVVFLWLSQFFTGIQYMIIAGAVSKWYFARDKNYLGSPILTSTSIAFKFHLGTVALGALVITLIQVIKSIILGLIKNEKIRIFVQYCIEAVERFFKFLSKNAYIITAMHGQAFFRSGKRAARLIIQNISDIIAVNYIGDFVLGMAKLLIVVISVLISSGILAMAPGTSVMSSNLPAYIVVGIVSILVACVTFGVFETTIDTIFVCYCEDNLLNDGMAKPYLMSRNLKEFVQESKEIYGKK